MSRLECATPLSLGILSDYWLGEVPLDEATPVEEHLLGCEACHRRLEWVIELAGAVHGLARRGVLRVPVSDEYLDRLAGEGLRIRQYSVAPGGSVACTVTAEDDVMVARLITPFQAPARADIVFCDAGGTEQVRLPDVVLDPARGDVAFMEPIDMLRRLEVATVLVRLVAVEGGAERIMGTYTFHHTRSGPAPAAQNRD